MKKLNAAPAVVWHYTTGDRLAGILADGALMPSGATFEDLVGNYTSVGLSVDDLDDATVAALKKAANPVERPAVWFSKHETWEPTATRGFIGPDGVRRTATMQEMIKNADGLVRVGIRPEGLLSWVQHRKTSGIKSNIAAGLVRVAVKAGANPGDWFVHYGPVPRAKWVAVQRWVDGRWRDADSPTVDEANVG